MQSSKPGTPVRPLKDSARAKAKWDPVVKVTHWSIVLAVIGNAIFTEEGSGPHVWVGYALATVLALRLLWGFVGPKEARFTAFPPSPRKALAHIREIRAGHNEIHPSHNPLGALMVYAIWGTLSIIIATGIGMAGLPSTKWISEAPSHAVGRGTDDRDSVVLKGSKRKEASDDAEDEPLKEVHETAVNLLYVLIALHLAGVVFETRRSGKYILTAMLPGRAQ